MGSSIDGYPHSQFGHVERLSATLFRRPDGGRGGGGGGGRVSEEYERRRSRVWSLGFSRRRRMGIY